jgi:hypothetical protein
MAGARITAQQVARMSGAISGIISFNFKSRMSLRSCGLHGRVICPMTGKLRMGIMRILPVVPICRTSARLLRRANQMHRLAHPASMKRGVTAESSRNVGRDAVDATVSRAHEIAGRVTLVSGRERRARRAALLRTAKSCGPGIRC